MTWLSPSDAKERGIDVTILENPSRQSASPRARQPLSHADLQQRATTFILGVIDQWSAAPQMSLRFFSNVYTDQVEYYGSLRGRDEVLKEKSQLLDRWPIRKYVVRPNSLKVLCEPATWSCQVSGLVDWRASSEERNALSTGLAEFDYKVRLTSDGFIILAEKGAVLSRQIDKLRR